MIQVIINVLLCDYHTTWDESGGKAAAADTGKKHLYLSNPPYCEISPGVMPHQNQTFMSSVFPRYFTDSEHTAAIVSTSHWIVCENCCEDHKTLFYRTPEVLPCHQK